MVVGRVSYLFSNASSVVVANPKLSIGIVGDFLLIVPVVLTGATLKKFTDLEQE